MAFSGEHLITKFVSLSAAILAATLVFAPAARADDEGKSILSYISIPFGGTETKASDVQVGLQLMQDVRTEDSQPLVNYGKVTVFDVSFTQDGIAKGDLMGVDMVKAFKLMNEPISLGQNAGGMPDPVALLLTGGAATAAILCIAEAICNKDKPPAPTECVYDIGFTDKLNAIPCETFTDR